MPLAIIRANARSLQRFRCSFSGQPNHCRSCSPVGLNVPQPNSPDGRRRRRGFRPYETTRSRNRLTGPARSFDRVTFPVTQRSPNRPPPGSGARQSLHRRRRATSTCRHSGHGAAATDSGSPRKPLLRVAAVSRLRRRRRHARHQPRSRRGRRTARQDTLPTSVRHERRSRQPRAQLGQFLAGADLVLLNIEGAIGAGPAPPKVRAQLDDLLRVSAAAERRQPRSGARSTAAWRWSATSRTITRTTPATDGRDTTVARLDAAGIFVTGADTIATPVVAAVGRHDRRARVSTPTRTRPMRAICARCAATSPAPSERYGTVIVTMHLGAEGPDGAADAKRH